MFPLAGQHICLTGDGHAAAAYAAALLQSLGAGVSSADTAPGDAAAVDWAESGLMYLCGEPGQAPRQGPAALPSCARGALQALSALAPAIPSSLDGAQLLSERAAIMGLQRHGAISPNQSCRLLAAADGWLAINLARPDDWELLPAWLEWDGAIGDWQSLESLLAGRALARLVERGRLLGLPMAAAGSGPEARPAWFRVHRRGLPAPGLRRGRSPLVVDLSSLWAGPLCSHLLQLAGARVIKVESAQRLDGGRRGSAAFYHLLNADKQSVVLELAAESGRRQLRALIAQADIVIEGSRPRALRQMGIDADALVEQVPGLVWMGISGYGRREPEANWVAFGDDAAVAAGVAAATGEPPVFCGDALADPLTGLHAALAALAFWQRGGGVVLDLSLCGVTACCLRFGPQLAAQPLRREQNTWWMDFGEHRVPVARPQARQTTGRAAQPGRDNAAVIREFGLPC